MKLNTRSKGLRIQRLAKLNLENDGWLVHNQPIGGRFNRFKDIFNLWDLIAVKKRQTLWVQVKCRKVPLNIYEKWCKKYEQEGLLMVWKNRKGFKIYPINCKCGCYDK